MGSPHRENNNSSQSQETEWGVLGAGCFHRRPSAIMLCLQVNGILSGRLWRDTVLAIRSLEGHIPIKADRNHQLIPIGPGNSLLTCQPISYPQQVLNRINKSWTQP